LGTYTYNFSKWEKPQLWENEIVLIKLTAVTTTSSQNSLRTEADNKKERAILTMCLCFLSATSFCSRVYVHNVWWMVSSKASNSQFIRGVFPSQITLKTFDNNKMLSFDKSSKGCIYLKEFRMMFH